VENRIAQGLAGFSEPPPRAPQPQTQRIGPLLVEWKDNLANRSAADDRSRIDRHLIPKFAEFATDQVTLAVVMRWLDELRRTTLSGGRRGVGGEQHKVHAAV
jgi:hypothetical protein